MQNCNNDLCEIFWISAIVHCVCLVDVTEFIRRQRNRIGVDITAPELGTTSGRLTTFVSEVENRKLQPLNNLLNDV
jgi:hypothetical protein